MALGASRARVLALILGQGVRLTALGLVVGLGIAIGVTRLMRTLLLDVSPTDIQTILAVVGLLTIVTIVASAIPAHRAARIELISAIRHE